MTKNVTHSEGLAIWPKGPTLLFQASAEVMGVGSGLPIKVRDVILYGRRRDHQWHEPRASKTRVSKFEVVAVKAAITRKKGIIFVHACATRLDLERRVVGTDKGPTATIICSSRPV